MIKPDECVDDLQIDGLRIIQKKDGFKFGIDAVILSDFAKNACSGKILDMCSGTGIIPLLLSAKTSAERIYGLEIQTDMAEMSKRSMIINNIQDRVHIVEGDLKNASMIFGKSVFDTVTCNPPYMEAGKAIMNDHDAKTVSRHEVMCSLEDVISAAYSILKPLGKFFMVHRPGRIADILCCMRKYRLEPKTLRFVYPDMLKAPKMVLIEGRKNSGKELRILPPLFVYKENGGYSDEINRIYGRK